MQEGCDGRPTEHARRAADRSLGSSHKIDAMATHEARYLCARRTPEDTPTDINTQG